MQVSRDATLRCLNGSSVGVGLVAREPHRLSRLAQIIISAGMECRAAAATASDLQAAAPDLDVVVLHDTSGSTMLLDAVRDAKEALPEAMLIVVCSPAGISDARKALRAGAAALVSEPELDDTLVPSIDAVRSGLICVPRAMRAPLESETLSMREKQILGMLVMGLTNADIAAKLYVAESTVKSHLSSAYAKLGVRTRKEAATMILDPTEGLGPGILATWPASGVSPSDLDDTPRPQADVPASAALAGA
jgi:DNA-binding NarL/FixJ family response regulator